MTEGDTLNEEEEERLLNLLRRLQTDFSFERHMWRVAWTLLKTMLILKQRKDLADAAGAGKAGKERSLAEQGDAKDEGGEKEKDDTKNNDKLADFAGQEDSKDEGEKEKDDSSSSSSKLADFASQWFSSAMNVLSSDADDDDQGEAALLVSLGLAPEESLPVYVLSFLSLSKRIRHKHLCMRYTCAYGCLSLCVFARTSVPIR